MGGREAPPPGCNELIGAFTPSLGPVALRLISTKLIMAGLLLTELSLPEPTLSQRIAVTISIEQKFKVFSQIDPGKTCELLPELRKLRTTSFEVKAGKPAKLTEIVRLPPGRNVQSRQSGHCQLTEAAPVRASTHIGTKTPIEVEHHLVVTLDYADDAGVQRMMELKKRLYIAHCSCIDSALALPEYSPNSEKAVIPDDRGRIPVQCNCLQTTAELMATAGVKLLDLASQPTGSLPLPPKVVV